MLARLLLCYNQRDSMSTIYQTASSIYSTKCESFMVQSQRNTVTNGIAERNTGAPFIALNFPLNSAVRACKSLALATDLTDYLMESGVGDLHHRRLQMVSEFGHYLYCTCGSCFEQVCMGSHIVVSEIRSGYW